MYAEPKWQNLSIASAISSEFTRLVLSESKVKINKNDYLNSRFAVFYNRLQNTLETACALGGMVFKTYVSNNEIIIDAIRADCFTPVAFTANGDMTSAVFLDRKTVGKYYYTRLDFQER